MANGDKPTAVGAEFLAQDTGAIADASAATTGDSTGTATAAVVRRVDSEENRARRLALIEQTVIDYNYAGSRKRFYAEAGISADDINEPDPSQG